MPARPLRTLAAGVAAGALLAVLCAAPGTAATAAPPPSSSPDAASVRVEAAADDATQSAAAAMVAKMSVQQKAAAVVMGHIPTTDTADLARYMKGNDLGGFILMGANIPGGEAALRRITAALTVDPALPPLIAVDEEGGDVTRLPWDDFAGAVTLKSKAPDATEEAFLGRGALVSRAGIGVNFGIVADVTDDPGMFIYRRALGTTPDKSAARVTAALSGEAGQVISVLKHFPGHGAAPGDSHSSLPKTTLSKAAWQKSDAVPFQKGIAAGAPMLMFGHLRYTSVDSVPASLSATWHAIARDELGFTGVSITDDLGMLQASGVAAYDDPVANAVAALRAGNDMVLSVMFTTSKSAPNIVKGIVRAVGDGSLPAARLDEAATRVMTLRLQLAAEGAAFTPCADCGAVG